MNRRDLLARGSIGTGAILASAANAGCLSTGGPGADDGSSGDSDGDDPSGGDRDPIELGALEGVDDPARLSLRNDDERTRAIDLTVTLASASDELEKSIELSAGEALEVLIGDPAGYDLELESDGSSVETSVRRADGGETETSVVLTADGVRLETDSSG